MSLIRIDTRNMSRSEWLAERRKAIGGSDTAAILGLSPYATPYSLWAEKTGRLPEKEDTEAMRQGRDLEQYVADRFTELSGKKTRKVNAILKNPDYPFAIANIDRDVIGESAGLECKTTGVLNLKRFKNGEFPENYYTQSVHYMAVTGYERWYVAALVLNKAFFVYQLTRIADDSCPTWCQSSVYVPDEEIEALMDVEKNFWQMVERDTPPPPDGMGATTDAIQTVFRGEEGNEVELFGREDKLAEYFRLTSEKQELEQKIEKIKQILMTDMGSASVGHCGSYKINWKEQVRRTLDGKKLQQLYPDVCLDGCYKITQSRPFKITEEK